MQISSTKQSSKKNMVDMLIEIGYSKQKAENLYQKYKGWGKLDKLQEYIDAKQILSHKHDPITFRDM